MPVEQNIRSGWKWAAAILLALFLLAAWIHRQTPASYEARHMATTAAPQPRPLGPRPTPATPASSKTARPAANSDAQVCGLGNVPTEIVDAGDLNQYVMSKTKPALDRWESALLNSGDLRSRAVGLIMRQIGKHTSQERAAQAAAARAELVQLAAGTDDPIVYGLAVGQCQKSSTGDTDTAGCERISLSRWAQLDPTNATPWLALAQAAHQKGDSAAEAAAIATATQARQIDTPGASMLLSLAQSEVPQNLTPLEQVSLSAEFIGIEAASFTPIYSEISRYCSTEALHEEKTHAQCDTLAHILVDHSNTLIDLSIGLHLAERIGWPKERLSELTQERADLLQTVPDYGEQNPWSCESVARINTYLDKRMQLGELRALRYFREHPSPP